MEEQFEQEVEAQLEALREQVRFLEYQIALTKPQPSPARIEHVEWNGQEGTIGAIMPKIGDMKKAPTPKGEGLSQGD